MSSPRLMNQDYYEKFKKATEGKWGLGACFVEHKCKFCQRYAGTDFVLQYRNLFVGGVPVPLLGALLDRNSKLTPKDIDIHANRQSWYARRAQIRRIVVDQNLVSMLALQRFVDTQRVVSPNSADKSLELLSKIAGVGKEINIQGQINHTWEQMLSKGKSSPDQDLTITIIDEEIVELPDDMPMVESHSE